MVFFGCNFCRQAIEKLEDGQAQWHMYRNGEISRFEIAHNDCARTDCEWGCDLNSFIQIGSRYGNFDWMMEGSAIRDEAGYQRLISRREAYWSAIAQGREEIV